MTRMLRRAERRQQDGNSKRLRHQLSVLVLAREVGNFVVACRQRGLDLTSLYECKRRVQTQGHEGLKDLHARGAARGVDHHPGDLQRQRFRHTSPLLAGTRAGHCRQGGRTHRAVPFSRITQSLFPKKPRRKYGGRCSCTQFRNSQRPLWRCCSRSADLLSLALAPSQRYSDRQRPRSSGARSAMTIRCISTPTDSSSAGEGPQPEYQRPR